MTPLRDRTAWNIVDTASRSANTPVPHEYATSLFAWMLTFRDSGLLAEREIFQDKFSMRSEEANKNFKHESHEIKHGPELYQVAFWAAAASC